MTDRVAKWEDVGYEEEYEDGKWYRYVRVRERRDEKGVRWRYEYVLKDPEKVKPPAVFSDVWDVGNIPKVWERYMPGYKPPVEVVKPKAKKSRKKRARGDYSFTTDTASESDYFVIKDGEAVISHPWHVDTKPETFQSKPKTPIKQIEKWKTRDE